MEGEILSLDEMSTKHIFNSMKMAFNHLADTHGGTPVWFTVQYREYREAAKDNPVQLARLVVFFIQEIQRRGDLPERYSEPFRLILEQITPPKLEGLGLLPRSGRLLL